MLEENGILTCHCSYCQPRFVPKVLMSYFLAQSSFEYFQGSFKRLRLISEENFRWYHTIMVIILVSFMFFFMVEWGLYLKLLFGYKNDIVALEQLEDVFGANTNKMLAIAQGLTVSDCVFKVLIFVYLIRRNHC